MGPMNSCGHKIKYQFMSYILNFTAEIIMILTYDPGSTDQIMIDSHFHIMCK
jgi:hypothetical protein